MKFLSYLILYFCLSGCAALVVDVDVYNGPLNSQSPKRIDQVAAMITAAKPMIGYIKHRAICPTINYVEGICKYNTDIYSYQEDSNAINARKTSDIFQWHLANEILALYEGNKKSPIDHSIIESLKKLENNLHEYQPNYHADIINSEQISTELFKYIKQKLLKEDNENFSLSKSEEIDIKANIALLAFIAPYQLIELKKLTDLSTNSEINYDILFSCHKNIFNYSDNPYRYASCLIKHISPTKIYADADKSMPEGRFNWLIENKHEIKEFIAKLTWLKEKTSVQKHKSKIIIKRITSISEKHQAVTANINTIFLDTIDAYSNYLQQQTVDFSKEETYLNILAELINVDLLLSICKLNKIDKNCLLHKESSLKLQLTRLNNKDKITKLHSIKKTHEIFKKAVEEDIKLENKFYNNRYQEKPNRSSGIIKTLKIVDVNIVDANNDKSNIQEIFTQLKNITKSGLTGDQLIPIEEAIQQYKKCLDKRTKNQRDDCNERESERFILSLRSFSEKILFLANNIVIIDDSDKFNLSSSWADFKALFSGNHQFDANRFIAVLQAIGNSTNVLLNDIERQNYHLAKQHTDTTDKESSSGKKLADIIKKLSSQSDKLHPISIQNEYAKFATNLNSGLQKQLKACTDVSSKNCLLIKQKLTITTKLSSINIIQCDIEPTNHALEKAKQLISKRAACLKTKMTEQLTAIGKKIENYNSCVKKKKSDEPECTNKPTDSDNQLAKYENTTELVSLIINEAETEILKRKETQKLILPDMNMKGKNSEQVWDMVLANLSIEHVLADKAGDKKAKQKLTDAINTARYFRSENTYLRAVPDAIRMSMRSSNLLNSKDIISLQNMIGHSFVDDSVDAKKLKKLDEQYWLNVNRVAVKGGGDVNYVIVKDDIGNWYIKQYAEDKKEIMDSMKKLSLFNMKKKNLLSNITLDNSLEQSNSPSATEKSFDILIENQKETLIEQVINNLEIKDIKFNENEIFKAYFDKKKTEEDEINNLNKQELIDRLLADSAEFKKQRKTCPENGDKTLCLPTQKRITDKFKATVNILKNNIDNTDVVIQSFSVLLDNQNK